MSRYFCAISTTNKLIGFTGKSDMIFVTEIAQKYRMQRNKNPHD